MGAVAAAYLLCLPLVFVFMCAAFALSLWLRRNDVADVAWGIGFVLIAWTTYLVEPTLDRRLLVTVLATLWGVRLALHLALRNAGKPEDHRYRNWREQWGGNVVLRSFLQVFMLQGFFMLVVSAPIVFVNAQAGLPLGIIDYAALSLFGLGFVIESLSDWQLLRFKWHPESKGRVMQQGLWAWSRHPNYFGELLQWWALGLLALAVPMGWLALMGPLTITWLILGISGIPMLERKAMANPDYQDYQRRVSVLVPLPPRAPRAAQP